MAQGVVQVEATRDLVIEMAAVTQGAIESVLDMVEAVTKAVADIGVEEGHVDRVRQMGVDLQIAADKYALIVEATQVMREGWTEQG
jgi:hypothetical protein